jgi:capsular polysaccharide biosynthesis protein
MVVGETGAAMANLGFCPPGATVLELQPERFSEDWTRSMCFVFGHRWHVYFAAVAPAAPGDRAEADRASRDDFSYAIDVADLEQAVREVMMRNEVPRAPAGAASGAPWPGGMALDPAVALRELRRCLAAGQVAAARQICETVFAPLPDYTDEYGHPVYLKEALRLALAGGEHERASTIAAELQGRVAPADPVVQVIQARQFARQGDRLKAREQWRAALQRDPNLAEAKVWLAADSEVARPTKSPPPPSAPARAPAARIGGLATIAFQDTDDLAGFAQSGRDERLRLFASLAPPPQLPLHDEARLEPAVVLEHHRVRPVPEAAVYAVTGCELSAIGLLTRGTQFFHRDDCLPNYFLNWLNKVPHAVPLGLEGSLGRADAELIRLDQPVACAFHPNVVWGHFLVEILPRLFLVDLLARLGRPIPLAAPSDAPEWLKRFAVTYGTAGGLLWYDPKRHRLQAPVFVVPNMMHVDWALGPMFNLLVSDLLARCGVAETSVPEGPRRLYLSRGRITWAQRLQNGPEVEAMLQSLGFTVVHPETLSVPEQLRLMRAAEVVVAEYASALHNTLFARPGTRVVAINRHNWLQGEIARIRRQTLAYVPPADGVWRDASKEGEARKFTVDIPTLRRVVQEMLEPGPRR